MIILLAVGVLIGIWILAGVVPTLILRDQYMAIVMGARTFAPAFKERGLAPGTCHALSRIPPP